MNKVKFPQIFAVVGLGLAVGGCRQHESSSTAVVEVGPFVGVKLRAGENPEDLSKAKRVGTPTEPQLKEVEAVIGRIPRLWRARTQYVRFSQRPDGVNVDVAIGHDFISMRKVGEKWVIYAKGSMF